MELEESDASEQQGVEGRQEMAEPHGNPHPG